MNESRLPKSIQAELRVFREKVAKYESRAKAETVGVPIIGNPHSDAPIVGAAVLGAFVLGLWAGGK